MYLTYDEYIEKGGTLSETDFDFLAYEAGSYIDWYTFNRLKKYEEIPQQVKDCEFYIIRLIQIKLGSIGVGSLETDSSNIGFMQSIASQSNDGVSVSYNSLSARDAISSISNEIEGTIQRQLRGVTNELGRNLLYRGLYPDE